LPPDRAKNLKSPSCQNISDRFKGKEWLVLIRPPLAGFDSTADTLLGKLVQTRHGMEAIDGDSILSVKTVIRAIFNGSSIEQTQALNSQIKAFFADLVGSPHTHCTFGVHSQFDRFIELKVSPDR
jgi:hypothetical protein